MHHSTPTDPKLAAASRGRRRGRRRSWAAAPDGGAARSALGADPLAEVAARRKRRTAARLVNLLLFLVLGLTALPLSAMIYIVHTDYSWLQRQVDVKEAQLAAFKSQDEVGERRLAALRSDKGRDELLIQRGYVPPGDRILLFPASPEEQRLAAIPANDVAPHSPLVPDAPPGTTEPSVWRRAIHLLGHWWGQLRAGARAPAATPAATRAGSNEVATDGDSGQSGTAESVHGQSTAHPAPDGAAAAEPNTVTAGAATANSAAGDDATFH